jgi:hypothetical protein
MKRVIATAVATLFLVALAASSASAGPGGTPFGALGPGPSINAGYVYTATTVRHVSGNLVMPTATCTSTDSASTFWVGLADSAAQTTARLGVDADCRAGQAVYVGWFKLRGQPRSHLGRKIVAGDSMSLDLAVTNHLLSGGLSDNTAGWGVAFGSNIRMQPDAAGVMASERTGTAGVRPLTDFGTATFTKVSVDGVPTASLRDYRVVMVNRDGVVQAKPSRLTPHNSFRVVWLHA